MEMTKEMAQTIREEYEKADEMFRMLKKRGDFKKASEWKTRRDALDITTAIKVLNS